MRRGPKGGGAARARGSARGNNAFRTHVDQRVAHGGGRGGGLRLLDERRRSMEPLLAVLSRAVLEAAEDDGQQLRALDRDARPDRDVGEGGEGGSQRVDDGRGQSELRRREKLVAEERGEAEDERLGDDAGVRRQQGLG